VENNGPYKCLSDSGTVMPIAKRSIVQQVMSPIQTVGQIKLQGIFGEPVPADLVSLQVKVVDEQGCNYMSVPVVFAVTDALVQNCDFILPVDVVCKLQSHTAMEPAYVAADQAASSAVVTKSHSDRGVLATDQSDNGDNSGDDNLLRQSRSHVRDEDDDEVDNCSGVDCSQLENIDHPIIQLNNESDRDVLISEQKTDATLDPCRCLADQNKGDMFLRDGLLYHRDEICGQVVEQLCVPHGRRLQVMRLAHDAVMSGHLGGQKTRERIRLNFFWPNMKRDISAYTASCQPCQLRARAKRTDHVPIMPIVRPTVPFLVTHLDVIGPLEPPSTKGYKWALCIIDDCTRWPAVFLLKSLTAKAMCDALLELFSIVGLAEIVCTDRGTNFCSQLTQQFLTRLGVAPRFNTANHPEAAEVKV